jgi:two-component system chemotaxis response regulator CheB
MKRIRVLVIEDSLTVRKRIVELLASREEFEVVGEAGNGKIGIELCQALRPDAVTLDMMMPVMSGLAATEYIMAYCPTPILIVSSSTNRGELFKTYEALAAGALDVLEKPRGADSDEAWEGRLLSTLRLISRIKVITHPRARLGKMGIPPGNMSAAQAFAGRNIRLIAIGASTGGPGAVLEILKGLPSTFPIPILLVLHLGRTFASAFSDWLDGGSPIRVAYAQDGERLPQPGEGRVVLAPPDGHLIVKEGRLRVTYDAERHSCRPSVDVLFESVAREMGHFAAGCLLTGMGKDGAEGLLAMRRSGGITLAQDEETCVVFGMPREAILLGAAEKVLPLQRIAPALRSISEGLSP